MINYQLFMKARIYSNDSTNESVSEGEGYWSDWKFCARRKKASKTLQTFTVFSFPSVKLVNVTIATYAVLQYALKWREELYMKNRASGNMTALPSWEKKVNTSKFIWKSLNNHISLSLLIGVPLNRREKLELVEKFWLTLSDNYFQHGAFIWTAEISNIHLAAAWGGKGTATGVLNPYNGPLFTPSSFFGSRVFSHTSEGWVVQR